MAIKASCISVTTALVETQLQDEVSMTTPLSTLIDSLKGPIDLSFHLSTAAADEVVSSRTGLTSTRTEWTCECRIANRSTRKREVVEEKLTEAEVLSLLETASMKANFQHLRLSSDGSPIPLEKVVRTAWSSSLQTFIVTRGLVVTSATLKILVQALTGHPSLRSVCLYDIAIPNQDTASSQLLDPLVYALSTIPNLECVDTSICNFSTDEKGPAVATSRPQDPSLVQPSALRALIRQSPHLQELSLWNWRLDDTHLEQGLAPALQQQKRRSRLRFMSLRQNPLITNKGWDSFYDSVLEDNYTLLHVMSDLAPDTPRQEEGQLQLKLNQMDRGVWLDHAQGRAEIWCDCLAAFGQDLDSLYYWMKQANPTLIKGGNSDGCS